MNKWEGRSRWQHRRTLSSLPLVNTSKIRLPVEQFSLKTDWKPAEGCLQNQGYKKDPHRIGMEGKRSNQVGTCAPGRDTEEERYYTGLEILLGSERFEHTVGNPALGSDTGRMSPPRWFENQWDRERAVRNLDSTHEECAHTCLLQKQGRESRLKLHGTLASFLQLPWHAPARVTHLLQPLLPQHCCPLGWRCWEGEEHTLKSQLPPNPKGFCSSNLRLDPAPYGAVTATEKPQVRPGSGPSSFISRTSQISKN